MASEASEQRAEGFSPPYISFRTLLNAIQRMHDEGMPSRLDRSYLSNLPWSTQNHFLASCRALGLIDTDGKPTQMLIQLVELPDERPKLVGSLLRTFYPGATSLSQNATQAQLEDEFKGYGLGGSTSRKAIAFFLHAAAFAEVPLSPHFRSPRTTTRAPARRRTRAAAASAAQEASDENAAPGLAAAPLLALHPFIQGLLRELPQDESSWTAAKRVRWLQMAELTVDMLYTVEDEQ